MRTGEALRTLLDDAHEALKGGDAVDAERRAKAVSAILRAERDVAEFLVEQSAADPEEDEEALRAELRGRLRRLADGIRAGATDEDLERIANSAGAA